MNTFAAFAVVAIYLRVSTQDQASKGYSLPEQREQCLRKARETLGTDQFEPVIFEDAAPGDSLDRPALETMREFVRTNKPALFVCMDPDRFSRELFIQLLVTREIEAAGARLSFVNHDYQKTPEGIMFYQFRGAIAQFEKHKILERTKMGLRRMLKDGKVANGTRAFGYKYDSQIKSLRIVPEEADVLRQIFAWASEKVTPLHIADHLNALGVPTCRGGKWRSSTIQGMLRNTTYVGQMRCLRWNTAGYAAQKQLPKEKRQITPKQRPKSEWVTVEVTPIIAPDLFQAVQKTFRVHKRTAKCGAGILSGILRCGLCGDSVHYISDRVMGHVLRCNSRYPRRDGLTMRDACKLPNVRASKIEEKVWAELTEWFADPEAALIKLESRLNRHADADHEQYLLASKDQYMRQLTARRKEQAVVITQMAAGNIDKETGEAMLADHKLHIAVLGTEIATLEDRLQGVREAATSTETFRERLEAMAGDADLTVEAIRLGMEDMPIAKRQAAVRRFIKEVLVFPGRSCRVVPDL